MRCLVRRVSDAQVRVDGHKVGEIKGGLLLFLGVAQADEEADLRWLLKKVLGIRLFPDEEGRMNKPLGDEDGILVISQFTLFGKLRKGFRPSFNRAAEPGKARSLYEQFVDGLKKECKGPVSSGEFGGDMQIDAVDEGPVTIWLDSAQKDY